MLLMVPHACTSTKSIIHVQGSYRLIFLAFSNKHTTVCKYTIKGALWERYAIGGLLLQYYLKKYNWEAIDRERWCSLQQGITYTVSDVELWGVWFSCGFSTSLYPVSTTLTCMYGRNKGKFLTRHFVNYIWIWNFDQEVQNVPALLRGV